MTAEGQFRNCLFSTREWDLRTLLRTGASDDQILATMRDSVAAKAAAHGIDSEEFQRPAKAMYQIGG
jgi:cyclic pyranopterin phosphate synthase